MNVILFICVSVFGICRGAMQWSFLDWAQTNEDRHSVLSPISVDIDGVQYSASYNELIKDGALDPGGSGEVLGQLYDGEGRKLYGNNEEGTRATWKMISNNPDFVSILQSGDRLFAVAHYETPLPSSVYVLELQQSPLGDLTVLNFHYLNASQYDGIWNPCAGSVSPWNTHLGSEEYSPNGLVLEVSDSLEDFLERDSFVGGKVVQYMKYYGLYPKWVNIYNIRENFKPYLYGYPFEVTFLSSNTYNIVKHMAMGRLSIELPKVMPDNRTVYITSDGTNKPLVMFKAKTAGDLSKGDLYAARFTQVDANGGGEFMVEWIALGYAEDDDLLPYARTMKFSDMFEFQEPMMSLYPTNGGCPPGYKSINSNIAHECLQVKQGMELFASRFETERYAATLGATTEWRKWEGITYSSYDNRIYTSISELRYGMEDFMSKGKPSKSFDEGGNNDIRLVQNPCGCVYYMDVDADFVATTMNEFLCGEPQLPTEFDENECRVDKIASPDNLAAVDGHAGLLIAEDSDGHVNNVLWYYDLREGKIQRILSGPYGCEITGAYFHPNINGFSYIMAQVQHPYGQRDQHKVNEPESFGKNAVIGYFGPFPATSQNPNDLMQTQTQLNTQVATNINQNVVVNSSNVEKQAQNLVTAQQPIVAPLQQGASDQLVEPAEITPNSVLQQVQSAMEVATEVEVVPTAPSTPQQVVPQVISPDLETLPQATSAEVKAVPLAVPATVQQAVPSTAQQVVPQVTSPELETVPKAISAEVKAVPSGVPATVQQAVPSTAQQVVPQVTSPELETVPKATSTEVKAVPSVVPATVQQAVPSTTPPAEEVQAGDEDYMEMMEYLMFRLQGGDDTQSIKN